MRSTQSGLMALVLGASAVLGWKPEGRVNPLQSFGQPAAVEQDGWIESKLVRTNVLQVVTEPEEPLDESPPRPAEGYPNNYIKGVTWSGTGCPNGADAEEPSVQMAIDAESDLSVYWFENFAVSLGLDGVYGPETLECALVLDVANVPAGWRFGFIDSRAEGDIYLETGSIANFTTDIWWGDDLEAKGHNMKYWPNLDKTDPVNVRYMTTPYMLDAAGAALHASSCPAEGPFSGKLTVKLQLSMMAANAEAKPKPRALVDILALGLTHKLIPCK